LSFLSIKIIRYIAYVEINRFYSVFIQVLCPGAGVTCKYIYVSFHPKTEQDNINISSGVWLSYCPFMYYLIIFKNLSTYDISYIIIFCFWAKWFYVIATYVCLASNVPLNYFFSKTNSMSTKFGSKYLQGMGMQMGVAYQIKSLESQVATW